MSGQTFTAALSLNSASSQIISRTLSADAAASTTGVSRAYTLDATGPGAPVVTALNPSLTEATAATGVVTVNAEAGSTVAVTFTQGANVVTKTIVGTGAAQTVALTSTELATLGSSATPIAISATATDVAGNASGPGTAQVIYNTIVPPVLPTAAVTAVTAFSADTGVSSNDFVTKTAAQTVSGTYNGTLASGEKIQFSTDGGVNWVDATANAATQTFSVALTLAANGTQIISRTLNAAGDASITGTARPYTLDTTAPTVPVVTPQSAEQNAAAATSTAGAVTVSAESGSSVLVTFSNGAHTVTKTVNSSGAPVKIQLTASELTTLTDGTISVSAVATDRAGNASSAGIGSFLLNTVTPIVLPAAAVNAVNAISSDSGVAADFITNQSVQTVSGTFTGTLEATDNIRVSADGGTTWVIAATGAGTWTAANLTLGGGNGQIITQTINASGNTLAGASHNYTLDTVASAPVFTLSTGSTLSGQTVINGTAEANATVTVTVDPDNNSATANSFAYTAVANASGVWSVNLATAVPSTGNPSFIPGTAKVSAMQTDVAGNTSTATNATYTAEATTSYSVVGPTDALGALLVGGVDEGAGLARFAILRSGDTSGSGTVTYTTQNSTATAGADYALTTDTVTFAAGETLKIVTVAITDDTEVEADETFSLNLTAATGGFVTSASATATINDNEQSVWSINSVPNVDEGAGTATFTITRTGKTNVASTIRFDTGGGTATSLEDGNNALAGADYTTVTNNIVSFGVGETSKTVTVNVIDDNLVETDEAVVGAISEAQSGFIAKASSTTIINDNEQPIWSITSSGNADEGAGFLTFIVSRTGGSGAATLNVATSGGNASSGVDYVAINQSLSFAAGEMSKTVQVAILNDFAPESPETLVASISNASSGSVAVGTATAAILDNDQTLWSISVANVSEGAGFITYTVSRTGELPASTINFFTGGGIATVGLVGDAARDYTSLAQTLSFAAGETSKVVQVELVDDSLPESNETVSAGINTPSSGSVIVASATATIIDNEQSVWSISADTVDEGAGFITYTVNRSGAAGAATIQLTTSGGSASAGSDYTALSNSIITFAAGETSKSVRVAVNDDTIAETNETVVGVLSNASSGTIATTSATATIQDNDQSVWRVSNNTSVSEAAGSISVVVSRTGATSAATLDLATFGTATPGLGEGGDYQPFAQTLSFNEGEMSKTIVVTLTNDTVSELDETVSIALSNISQGTMAATPTGFTIADDDVMNWAISSSGNLTEGAGSITFTVTRTGNSQATTIRMVTGGGTATEGVDYTAVNTLLSFNAGEMSKSVQVAVVNDTLSEQDETVVASLIEASVGSIAVAFATATILDDEQSLWSVSAASSVREGEEFASFIISRTGALAATTIDAFTSTAAYNSSILNNTAMLDEDYQAFSQTVSFAAGESSKTVQVRLLNDTQSEQPEFIRLNIENPGLGSLKGASADALILDDDGVVYSLTVDGNTPENSGVAVFRVSRELGRIDVSSTVDFHTTGTSAADGALFTPPLQTVSFVAGESTKFISIPITSTSSTQYTTITGFLSNASTGQFNAGNISATTNLNQDSLSIWAISGGATVLENAGTVTITVSRSGNVSQAASIDVSTLGGTATGGADASSGRYITLSETVNFAAGESSKTVQLRINNDTVVQGATNQTVIVGISNATPGGALFDSTSTAAVTLVDDDTMVWTSSAGYGPGQEGNDGEFAIRVSRTGPLTAATIESYLIGGNNTNSATLNDFSTPASTTLSFGEGESFKLVRIKITQDNAAEANEFISNAIGNQSAGQLSMVRISTNNLILANDLTRTTFEVADGTGGYLLDTAGAASFVITRNGDISGADSVAYNVAGTGGATAGTDFVAKSGTVVFAAGERTKVVSVALVANPNLDSGKGLTFTLQDASAGTIITPTVSVALNEGSTPYSPGGSGDAYVNALASITSVNESAGSMAFRVTRIDSNAAATTYVRTGATSTATAGSDFIAIGAQALNWVAGESIKIVRVQLLDDAVAESTETVVLEHSAQADFATITSTSINLLDNDTAGTGANTYTFGNFTLATENSGVVLMAMNRLGDLTQASTSYVRTTGTGTATPDIDFVPIVSKTVNWEAGESQKLLTISLIDDAVAERQETIGVQVASDSGFTQNLLSSAQFIINDDWQIMVAGVADTVTLGPASGTYLGGDLLDTGDGNDIVFGGNLFGRVAEVRLGSGDDRFDSGGILAGNMMARVDGGSGVDTFSLSGVGTFDYTAYSTFAPAGNTNDAYVTGFEILDLATATTAQRVNLSLANVLEMTRGNTVPNTMRITGTIADTLSLQADGKIWRTQAVGSSVTDVDGTVYTVSNSGVGNVAANEVTIGGQKYDVYGYVSDSQNLTLLVDTRMQNTAMGTGDEASDGKVGLGEAADGLTTTISLAGQNAVAGQTLSVVLNATSGGTSQTLTKTITATEVINGYAVINATLAQLNNSGTGSKTLTASVNGGATYAAGAFSYDPTPLAATAPTVTAGAEVWNDQTVGTGVGKITGTWDAAQAATGNSFGAYSLYVSVNGVTYTVGNGLTVNGNKWTLSSANLASLTAGSYNVVASVADQAGNSVVDADGTTTSELTVRSGNRFTDASAATGLPTVTNGSNTAVSIADFNGDGVKDIFVPLAGSASGATSTDTLYTGAVNSGTVTYTATTGLPSDTDSYTATNGVRVTQNPLGSTAIDYNNDGNLDLAVANGTNNLTLLRNNGAAAFTDVTYAAGINPTSYSLSGSDMAWGDYNGDGFVDVYLPSSNAVASLYTNNRDGSFAATTVTGMTTVANLHTDAIWADVTGDGRLDLLVANNSATAGSLLFVNSVSGTFAAANAAFTALTTGYTATAIRAVDYDNDGDLDLYIRGGTAGNLYKLLKNDGSGNFTDVTATAFGGTTAMTAPSNGSVWFDYDMDGYLDLIQGNNTAASTYVWHNNGDGTFSQATTSLTGLAHASSVPNGGWAVADLDNNGTQDLYMVGSTLDAVLNNNAMPTPFLDLKVIGSAGSTPLYGAKVQVFQLGNSTADFTQYVLGGTGDVNSTDGLRFYGLDASKKYEVKVTSAIDQDSSATVNLNAVTTTFNNGGAGYSALTTVSPVTLTVANNAVVATAGVTTTSGTSGDDALVAMATGKQVINGDAGTDTLSFGDGLGAGVVASWTSINSKDANGATGETSFGTQYNGTGTSWKGIENLQFDDGVDIVTDGAGQASIKLGAGNDQLFIGASALGTVAYDGEVGTNTLSFVQAAFAVNLAATTATGGSITSTPLNGTFANFTTITGSALADNLDFGAYTSATSINSGNGGDTVKGGSAADIITAGSGSDIVIGNAGNDVVNISAGGVDTLKYLALTSGSANAVWGNGADTVTGFVTDKNNVLNGTTEDIIDLSALFSGQGITVNAGNLSQYLNTTAATNSVLQIDRDGSGGAYAFANLVTLNAVSLTNTDLANLFTAGQLVL